MAQRPRFRHILESRLARTQLVRILIFSSIVTLMGTFIQLWVEYRDDIKSLDSQLDQIEASHLDSLSNSLWLLDNRQIGIQLDNILSLKDIVYIDISEKNKRLFSAGSPSLGRVKAVSFPMVHRRRGKPIIIGTLTVQASLDNVYRRLGRRIFIILVTQGLKTFMVSFFILFILYHQVIRHLISLSGFARKISLKTLDSGFALDRKKSQIPDELDILVAQLERMRARLNTDLELIKKTEQALVRREQQMTAILQATPDPLVRYDDKGSVLYVNPEFTKVFGWTLEELENNTVPFVPKEEAETTAAMTQAAYQSGNPIKFTSRRMTRQGDLLEVIVSGAAICDAHGGASGMVVNLTDISEQKRLEVQLQQSQKMESVGRLAGGVAHDFNNMLSIIMGHTEIIIDDFPASKEKISKEQASKENKGHPENSDEDSPDTAFLQSILEIQQAALRSAELVRQLLAFARKQTIAPQTLDLNRTTQGMLKMLQRLIGEDITLSWHPCEHLWTVKVDPSQIDQILVNLTVNARDAIRGAGSITIETGNVTLDESYCRKNLEASPGDYVMVAVSDNGCGMDKATRENLFEPFFTTKAVGQGTGLGLSTIYGIIKQNKGVINVYSEPGRGTTFRIYFPRVIEAGRTLKNGPTQLPVLGGHETLLLVEDEAPMLQITTRMLRRLGYHVLPTPSPQEALETAARLTEQPIHLLITDVVMPGINGRELAQTLKQQFPKLKCLYMSGYTANIIAHHGILDEGLFFISKPFSAGEIGAKVRYILDLDEKCS